MIMQALLLAPYLAIVRRAPVRATPASPSLGAGHYT